MKFRIADTFTDSLQKLTNQEQKAIKTTAFDLQLNPANPGCQMHKLDKCKDPNFWSARASRDVRIIVHRTKENLLLCYVDHHDDAYRWAENRKIVRHPKTGAAQLVSIREKVVEIERRVEITKPVKAQPEFNPFKGVTREDLLSYGVPEDWMDEVLEVEDEDELLDLVMELPGEAREALLAIAVGEQPPPAYQAPKLVDAFSHPDAERRFRVIEDAEELEQALDYPWEKWTIFLHPRQREFVEKSYSGPVRISGTAGTGKTVVALHRAAYLARENPDARVLLATFDDVLARELNTKLRLSRITLIRPPMIALIEPPEGSLFTLQTG